MRARREFLDERCGRTARAEDQHRVRLESCHQRHHASLAPGAVGEPATAHGDHEEQRHSEKNGARHHLADAQDRQRRRHRRAADRDGNQNALQIGQARVTPKPAIKPQRPEHYGVHHQHPGQLRQHHLAVVVGNVEVEAQPECDDPGQRRRGEVVGEDDEAPVVDVADHEGGSPRSAAPAQSAMIP